MGKKGTFYIAVLVLVFCTAGTLRSEDRLPDDHPLSLKNWDSTVELLVATKDLEFDGDFSGLSASEQKKSRELDARLKKVAKALFASSNKDYVAKVVYELAYATHQAMLEADLTDMQGHRLNQLLVEELKYPTGCFF